MFLAHTIREDFGFLEPETVEFSIAEILRIIEETRQKGEKIFKIAGISLSATFGKKNVYEMTVEEGGVETRIEYPLNPKKGSDRLQFTAHPRQIILLTKGNIKKALYPLPKQTTSFDPKDYSK